MKTKAAVLHELNKPLIIEDLEIPKLKEGQCLVEILYTGVCQSQLNEVKGKKGLDNYLPHTLGHEASGIIKEIGENVKKIKVDDYAVLSWIKGSGLNALSTEYACNGKKINAGAITTFAQYSVISENRITSISREIRPDVVALIGCAVPTGAGILLNKVNPSRQESLAIFGIGGVGASALVMARSLGLEKIIAVDIHDKKLELAKDLGATHAINGEKSNPVNAIYELTNGKGVDYAIEASGAKTAMENAYASANKNSGKVIFSGNLGGGRCISIDPYPLLFGRVLLGTGEHNTNPDKDFNIYGNMYLENRLQLEKLISRTYRLENINEALDALSKGEVFRSLIDFTKDKV